MVRVLITNHEGKIMRLSYFTVVSLLLGLHVLIPVVLIFWTLKKPSRSILGWLLQTATFTFYFIFIFLTGSWAFVSFYLRYALPVLFIIVAIISFLKAKKLNLFVTKGIAGWMGNVAGVVLSTVLLYLIIGAIRSNFYDEKPVTVSFPFKNGVFTVFEGGNGKASSLMNYHYSGAAHKGAGINRSMKYAVDITKLSIWGNDAKGFLPKENEKYAIFNEPVYSPCDGQIFDIVDKWLNETPMGDTAPYNVGNHIVIKSGDFLVLLGHLQRGSIQVRAGEMVTRGQPVAKAGNSGWTMQPHLHIQAMKMTKGSFWFGEGLPIYFDGKNPVKNTLLFESR
jgi:hypothetical protein